MMSASPDNRQPACLPSASLPKDGRRQAMLTAAPMKRIVDIFSALKKQMYLFASSTQLRLAPSCRSECTSDAYHPDVISLSRLASGSLGGGLLLTLIAIVSHTTGISVLFPPLAATCFIVSTCPHLRIARPKPVIVGHFIASICGLIGSWAGDALVPGSEYTSAIKLGVSVIFATITMQALDADHPPAAATSAIPAILPLPMQEYLLPIHMAWGATLCVMISILWNRGLFEFPTQTNDSRGKKYGVYMEKNQTRGTILCLAGFAMMCFQNIFPLIYTTGLICMLLGVISLGSNIFYASKEALSQ
ncbi:HPP family protein [uncultured Pseudodesulfovibrio sp.]|uniref:HPP family protein n=1 Tax=uncultured Pseudodesulfovibrio sp. TaxID=2035858 RepID=UPI0029C68339|nr:HPP family protein [uncultured Pseudodesulfovibrio sp.]